MFWGLAECYYCLKKWKVQAFLYRMSHIALSEHKNCWKYRILKLIQQKTTVSPEFLTAFVPSVNVFKYFSAVQWTFTKNNEPSKLFIFALENLHLYETYQVCFMLNVGTNSIFAGQVQEKTHGKQTCTSIKHFIIHRQKIYQRFSKFLLV